MKKLLAAMLLAAAALPFGAGAMDMKTLGADPARYRVVYADGKEAVYADTETMSVMQSRDFPASIENISCTLYAAKYAKAPDAMDFEEKKLVTGIAEYRADFYGNKLRDDFKMKKNLVAVYDAAGEALSGRAARAAKMKAEADDMFYTLHRAAAKDASPYLENPGRYRVVLADEDRVIYADTETLSGQQTMDYPSSLENLSVKLYAETYRDKASAMDFAKGNLVAGVSEYDAELHADKRDGIYEMETRPEGLRADAKGIYLRLRG